MLQFFMVKLDKIYTRGGDNGYTSIMGGKRVKKSSYIIEAIGKVDELNALLGLCINYLNLNHKKIVQNINYAHKDTYILGIFNKKWKQLY